MKGAPKLHVLTTGGAGYIGAVLTPRLLAAGHRVTVMDALVFGEAPLESVGGKDGFRLVRGDLRDRELVSRVLEEEHFDVVIHLAAISNDPSSELDPELTREVNLDAVEFLVHEAKSSGVGRFLYASSASVYGIKEEEEVTEDLDLEPITIYARYKAEGEKILNGLVDEEFCGVSVRAATVCGYSPRMRLDLTINILTEHAVSRGRIRVFGGRQQRPNIHIRDLADFYQHLVDAPADLIRGQAFNVSYGNASVRELAEMIRREVDPQLPIDVVPTDDQRSYRLSTGKLRKVLGFVPPTPLKEAVGEVAAALRDGRIAKPESPLYRNVEWLKARPELLRTFA
jgi:nucleoside-diphosphate-sugar epimerase